MIRTILMTLLLASVAKLSAQPLKVMSYNIRYDNPGDGINQWSNRKEKLAALIKQQDPDLIGLQEALITQITDLINLLPGYAWYGRGRDDGKQKGEFAAILVRKDRFRVLEDSTFWLSQTPSIPGFKGWDAALPRVATYVELLDQQTGKPFIYLNTHFDHVGVLARTNSAALIQKFLTDAYKGKMPVIMSGDLNVQRDTDAYHRLTDPKFLKDARPSDNTDPTFCGFDTSNTKCVAIDYILYSKESKVKRYAVLRDNDGKYYPSDHLPVVVELEIK